MPELNVANKLANIAFIGKRLEERLFVAKRRYRSMRNEMMAEYAKRGKGAAVPYALGLLEVINQIKLLRDTSMKIKFFVEYTMIQLSGDKLNQHLLDFLETFNDAAERGSINTLRSYLILFGKQFDLSIMMESEHPREYPEVLPIEITSANARKELKRAIALRKKKLQGKPLKENKRLTEIVEARDESLRKIEGET